MSQAPTADQLRCMLEYLEEHRDLARGHVRDVAGRERIRRLWDDLATRLNALGGTVKTVKQWQRVWSDRKYLAKKAAARARRSAAATGGGPSTAAPISDTDSRIVSIMGEGFGEPQTDGRVPVFFESTMEGSQEEAIPPPLPPQPLSLPAFSSLESILIETTQQVQSFSEPPMPPPASELAAGPSSAPPHPRGRRDAQNVRSRFFRLEEDRVAAETLTGNELREIRLILAELCQSVREVVVALRNRQ